MKTLILSLLLPSLALGKFNWEDYYTVETVPLPADLDPQIGGLDLMPDGSLVGCFHRGEVMIYNEEQKSWSTFATGLHEPLGIHADKDGSIYVVQRAELTRLVDEDGDGKADLYTAVSDDWGVSGNYHEFTFGLARDSQGNFYIGLGTASNGSGVRKEIRGEWNNTGGLTHDKFLYENSKEWGEKKEIIPRMYARVPYRGCVLKINPETGKTEVYATGLRTPNGLFVDKNDQLWVNDNQGDWVGASTLHRIQEGKFHGHAASLLWAENPPKVTPVELPVEELNAMRVKAAALLPQGDCGNSITEMITLRDSFAPISSGDLLIMGEMNHSRMPLYYPDTVNGQAQGAVSHFLDTPGVGGGINRVCYSPDGKSLYIGKTHLSWPGKEGLYKVTYKGKPFFQAQSFKLHPKGFEIHFNGKIKNSKRLNGYRIFSYEKLYHASYGSPKHDQREEKVVHVDNKGSSMIIELETPPEKNRVYDISLPPSFTSEDGDPSTRRFWYTAHEVY